MYVYDLNVCFIIYSINMVSRWWETVAFVTLKLSRRSLLRALEGSSVSICACVLLRAERALLVGPSTMRSVWFP